MINMLKNKTGQAFNWVYGLISLFGIGIMYVVFLYVFNNNLVVTIKDIVNTSGISASVKNEVISGIDKYLLYFEALPFILFGVVVLYMMASSIRKEAGSQYIE